MLIEVKRGIYYWQGGVNFGIVLGEDRQVVLIDAGLDASAPRKALKPFLDDGWRLAAVLATHGHTDHIGGCAELHRRYGCAVYAPAPEHVLLEHPLLAPMNLYGAYPPPGLQVKFLLPQAPCPVTGSLPASGTFSVAGRSFEVLPVPGHSPGQVALSIDGVLFAADAFFVPAVLAKHAFLFLVRVDEYLASLDKIESRGEVWVVPGHGAMLDRSAGPDPLQEAIAANRAHVRAVQEHIKAALGAGPLSDDQVLLQVAARLGKAYDSEPSYYLDRCALLAHLSDLARRGEVVPAYPAGGHGWRLA